MSKKITLAAVAVLLILVMTGCNDQQFKNGNYNTMYKSYDSHGWKPQLSIRVVDGKIAEATFDYVNRAGQKKTEDEAYASRMTSITKRDTTPKMASDGMAKQLVESQKVPVDGVTGATSSKKWFNELAAVTLDKAKNGDSTVTFIELNDTYEAKDDADDRGYTAEIAITFKDGKITEVVYNETGSDDVKKRDNQEYNDKMKGVSGTSWLEGATALEKALVEKQDVAKVDAVTGATSLSARFKKLAEEALSIR